MSGKQKGGRIESYPPGHSARHRRKQRIRSLIPEVCEFGDEPHFGNVEWHHPISSKRNIGVLLCQLHHSIMYGRKCRYPIERLMELKLPEIEMKLRNFIRTRVQEQGVDPQMINKD